MGMLVSRLDKNNILVRAPDYEEERIVKEGAQTWSHSAKAFVVPRPRLVEIVDQAKKAGIHIEYPEDMYKLERISKIAFESTLAALRAMRQTGCRAEDIDYFNAEKGHFKGKFLPYRHQIVTYMYCYLLEQCAVYNEMGTGKTASVCWCIDTLLLEKKIYSALVVAPNNILKNWEREIQTHTPRLKAVILQGNRNDRLHMLDMVADVYIINYEGLRVIGDELRHRFGCVVLDEGHKIKDPGATQTKIIHDLFSSVQYKLAMTGTPIGNNLLDLHQLMTWIDPYMFEPYFAFRAHWFNQYGFRWAPKPGTEKMMQEKVYTRAIRYKKEECLDLPPKTYITRRCKMMEVQQVAYKQMQKALMTMMEEGLVTAKNILSQIIKLSEITSGFIRDDNGYDHIFKECGKIDEMKAALEEIGPTHKVVIWARFIPDINRIMKELGDKAVALYGKTAKKGGTQAIVDKFNDDPSIMYLVGNPAVGGIGLNMTAASYMIYYSNDYSFIKRSQSEDRIHRMGSERHDKITIIDIVCEKTIDEAVVGALLHKKELSHVIIDAYKAGIGESFGLLKERKEAEDSLAAAADKLKDIDELINWNAPVYQAAMELEEPSCPECNSKSVSRTTEGSMKCNDCQHTYE